MVNIFFPLFDILNNWISKFLPFPVQNLIWGIIAGSLAFLIYWLLSNQNKIADIKDEMKIIRKKMFADEMDEKSEYNRLAKLNLSLSFKLLGKILLPAIISILPVIIIAIWYDINDSFRFPEEDEIIAVYTVPQVEQLSIKIDGIKIDQTQLPAQIQPTSRNSAVSVFANSNLIYSNNLFDKPIPYITKKKWWNVLLANPTGYLSTETDFEALILEYPEKIVFPNMPNIINGWELLFFVGIFISALPLRIIFKVQ